MKGINKTIHIGNVGSNPEVRYSATGSAVANFSIAINNSWKDKDTGEKKESTEWVRVVCFNKLAEIAGDYLHKGSKVYVEGSLRTRKWEKDGQNHYTTEVVAREMQMLDRKGDRQEDQSGGQQPDTTPTIEPNSGEVMDNGFDDSIPF